MRLRDAPGRHIGEQSAEFGAQPEGVARRNDTGRQPSQHRRPVGSPSASRSIHSSSPCRLSRSIRQRRSASELRTAVEWSRLRRKRAVAGESVQLRQGGELGVGEGSGQPVTPGPGPGPGHPPRDGGQHLPGPGPVPHRAPGHRPVVRGGPARVHDLGPRAHSPSVRMNLPVVVQLSRRRSTAYRAGQSVTPACRPKSAIRRSSTVNHGVTALRNVSSVVQDGPLDWSRASSRVRAAAPTCTHNPPGRHIRAIAAANVRRSRSVGRVCSTPRSRTTGNGSRGTGPVTSSTSNRTAMPAGVRRCASSIARTEKSQAVTV